MSYNFTEGKYRAFLKTSMLNPESGTGEYVYSDKIEFKSDYEPPVELCVFRTNNNIQIDPVTLEVPNATLDYQDHDGLFYSNGLEVIIGRNEPIGSIDRTKYKYLYIAFDNSSGVHTTYHIDYIREVAYMGIPYIAENYYSSDGNGCDNFDGGGHFPLDGNNCYINIGNYAQYASNKSNIALSLFHNIPRLSVENLSNLVQSNVVVLGGMFEMCGGFNQRMFEIIRDTWNMSNVLSVDYMFMQDSSWSDLDRVSDWQLEIIQNISIPNLERAQYTLFGTHIGGVYTPMIFSKGNNMTSLASHFGESDILRLDFNPTQITFNAHCRNSAYWDSDDDGYAHMCELCSLLEYVTTSTNVLSSSIITSSYPLSFKGTFLNCTSLYGIVMPEIQSTSTDTYGAALNMKEFVSGCTNLRTLQIGYSANNDSPIKLSARRIAFQNAFYGCQKLQKLNFIIPTTNPRCDFNVSTFTGCSSLTELNLNNMQTYGSIYLGDCTSLNILKCPQSITTSTMLPYTMYDSQGTAYTTMPGGNITLYKTNPTL